MKVESAIILACGLNATGQSPSFLVVDAFNTCPDSDSQSNDSRFFDTFSQENKLR